MLMIGCDFHARFPQTPAESRAKRWGMRYLIPTGKAIYSTRAGPFLRADWGVSTHRGNLAYVHVLKWNGESLRLPALRQLECGQFLCRAKSDKKILRVVRRTPRA